MAVNDLTENTAGGVRALKAFKSLSLDSTSINCQVNSQIVAEKHEYQTEFLKVNQEIDKLKERLSVNSTGDKTINNSNNNNNNNNDNGCAIITLANGSNQEETVSVVSTSNQASDQRSESASRACENVCKCGNTVQGEVNSVKVSDNHVNVNPGLLAGCSSLNELTHPDL